MEGEKETVRCCSDCKTTKRPMWRGGPSGPKVSSSTFNYYTYNFIWYLSKKRDNSRSILKFFFLWRKSESLCNACGIRFMRQRRTELLGIRVIHTHKAYKKINTSLLSSHGSVALKKRRRSLKEEEQAAMCLLLLSCSSVFAWEEKNREYSTEKTVLSFIFCVKIQSLITNGSWWLVTPQRCVSTSQVSTV